MLDYTKAAIKKTIEDFKKIDLVRNIATQVLYLVYLLYAVCVGSGFLPVNIILLTLAAAYFAFFLFVTFRGVKKQIKRTVRTVYGYCKHLLKLFNLGVMIYGISLTAGHVTPVSLLLSSLMIVGWVLQILFEVVFKFFLNRAQFILEGMEADYENLTKPVRTVGNFFKKIAGKEVEEEKEPSKNRLYLDKKVAQERAKKERQKEEDKLARKAKADLLRQDKAQIRAEKKAEKRKRKTQEIRVEEIPALPKTEELPAIEEQNVFYSDDEI